MRRAKDVGRKIVPNSRTSYLNREFASVCVSKNRSIIGGCSSTVRMSGGASFKIVSKGVR